MEMVRVRKALLLILLFVGAGCKDDVPVADVNPGPRPLALVVVTPHNETIRNAFGDAFSQWHAKEHGRQVNIRWVSHGTPQCIEYAKEAVNDDEMTLRGMVPDVMFGGGVSDHELLARQSLVRPVQLSDEADAAGRVVCGVPLTDPNGHWHATALTGFGILYHKQALGERQLPAPAAWADLADPAYFGWIALADPNQSGSNRFILDIILQRHGWEKGWGLILRTVANARTLLPSSTAVIDNVVSGMCLAGPCVNFNALSEVEAQGADRLGYVAPNDAAVITPDVVSVLKYATFPQLAETFVAFCRSEDGQSLWALRQSGASESASAEQRTLYRYAIDPVFYEKHAERLAVADNPFSRPDAFELDMAAEQKQGPLVAALVTAISGENHVLLQRAWQAVIEAGMPPERLAELVQPPFDEATAMELAGRISQESGAADALIAEWRGLFKERFQRVLGIAPE
jgi:ABC-type Fe3+ transport system substrate-binding protein